MAHQNLPGQLTFAWETCADLHNQILDIGWTAVLEHMDYEPSTKSWWEHYFGSDDDDDENEQEDEEEQKVKVDAKRNDEQPDEDPNDGNAGLAEELRRRLHPDVIKFLKRARHDYPGNGETKNFFYFLSELSPPRHIINMLNEMNELTLISDPPHKDGFIQLYPRSNCAEGCLLLNQGKMTASIVYNDDIYIYDIRAENNASKLTTLEEILRAFLEMIDRKRILAVGADFEFWDPQVPMEKWATLGDFIAPWVLPRDDRKIVDDTVTAWNNLLSAIESRIPGFIRNEPVYFDDEHIGACNAPGFFVGDFIRKARIPNFRFVASGLRMASPVELADQPFKGIADAHEVSPQDVLHLNVYRYKWYPFLFLRGDRKKSKILDEYVFNDSPWDDQKEFSAGLYITHTPTTARCDGCRLLLPYPINANKYARSGDGNTISDSRKYDGLYQAGHSLIPDLNDLRLELLFQNWTKMVESSVWKVDENGVTDGIEKFKDADTPDMWYHYRIERTW